MLMARRAFLSAGAALALLPRRAHAGEGTRLSFRGSLEQGGLVIGRVVAGAQITLDDTPARVSPEGMFVFGFSYDRVKPILVVAKYADGTSETSEVVPIIRQYRAQNINGLPEAFVTPSAEDLARIKRENALIYEVRARETDGVGFSEPFDWPIPGIITGFYGSQRVLNGKLMAPHLGIDIAAPEGTPIHAPADAVVSLAESDFYMTGGTSVLDHGYGVSTTYLHQSALKVAAGDKVRRGQLIGLVGQKGRATGPHTHWGLCWFQVKLDPSRSTPTPEPPKV